MGHYGIRSLVATTILAELGDTRRLSSSKQAVRCAGLHITVHESDTRRRAGHLSRQGSPVLRWGAFEAAQSAARPSSPHHDYYLHLKDRVCANRAALTNRQEAAAPRAPHAARARRRRDRSRDLTATAAPALPSVIDRGQLPRIAVATARR